MGTESLKPSVCRGAAWCGFAMDRLNLVPVLAPSDRDVLAEIAWMRRFAEESVELHGLEELLSHWRTGAATLLTMESRIIPARAFNQLCSAGNE